MGSGPAPGGPGLCLPLGPVSPSTALLQWQAAGHAPGPCLVEGALPAKMFLSGIGVLAGGLCLLAAQGPLRCRENMTWAQDSGWWTACLVSERALGEGGWT